MEKLEETLRNNNIYMKLSLTVGALRPKLFLGKLCFCVKKKKKAKLFFQQNLRMEKAVENAMLTHHVRMGTHSARVLVFVCVKKHMGWTL